MVSSMSLFLVPQVAEPHKATAGDDSDRPTSGTDAQTPAGAQCCRNNEYWGSFQPHNHLSVKNVTNFLLFVAVMVPSLLFVQKANTVCSEVYPDLETFHSNEASWSEFAQDILGFGSSSGNPAPIDKIRSPVCYAYLRYPIFTVNVLYVLNVAVMFWLVGLLQKSFWLIDPYWTVLPVLIAVFFRNHPVASLTTLRPDAFRSNATLTLLSAWALRQTHCYFQKEGFKFGQQEDWRYTLMARKYKSWWWAASFFLVGVAQQPFIIGIAMPVAAAHIGKGAAIASQWTDYVCALVALLGIVHSAAVARVPETHGGKQSVADAIAPKHYGQYLFWWGLCGLVLPTGASWMLGGAILNSAALLVDKLMQGRRRRRKELEHMSK